MLLLALLGLVSGQAAEAEDMPLTEMLARAQLATLCLELTR